MPIEPTHPSPDAGPEEDAPPLLDTAPDVQPQPDAPPDGEPADAHAETDGSVAVDARPDTEPPVCECNADVNETGGVSATDISFLRACIMGARTEGCDRADVNCDGRVDHCDLANVRCQLNNTEPDPVCCEETVCGACCVESGCDQDTPLGCEQRDGIYLFDSAECPPEGALCGAECAPGTTESCGDGLSRICDDTGRWGECERLVAPECTCNGDLDGDEAVGTPDFNIIRGCLGAEPTGSCTQADLDCDGDVDECDVSKFSCQFETRGAGGNPECCVTTTCSACCTDGECTTASEYWCTTTGGTYLYDGAACPPPGVACAAG